MSDDRKLPDGWRRVRFGDVVRQVKDRVDPESAGLDRYIAGEHMDTDDLKLRRWGDVGDGYLGPAFQMRFRPGQVLYGSRRTYLRKVAVADFEGICANTTFVMEPSTDDLLPEFLPHVMSAEAFHEHSVKQSKGSVNPYINFKDLTWYEFALPPIPEQHRIVEMLSASSNLLDHYRNVARELDNTINQVITAHYLRCRADYGLVPITDLADLTMGRQKAPRFETGTSPVKYLRVANIGHLEMRLDDLESMDFDDVEFEKYRVQAGDILLTEGDIVSPMNVGRCAVFPSGGPPCCFQNTLIRLRPRNGVLPSFLMALVEGARLSGLLAAIANTTTVSHLGLKRLSAVSLPAAPPAEQARVAQDVVELLTFRSSVAETRRLAASTNQAIRSRLVGEPSHV